MRLLLTGGRQRLSVRKREEWHLYDEARLVILDTETGKAELVLRHQTPVGERPDEMPSHIFKAAVREPETSELWVVSQTEVLCINCLSYEIKERFSHPWFNDLHHVAPINGLLHVVSTGLDSLISFNDNREAISIRHAMGDDPWIHFDRDIDYRLTPTTKPHRSHPNYVFWTPNGLWLTRFEQKDAICLDDPSRRIAIDTGKPHDGIVNNGKLWFTTVNGYVICVDPQTGKIVDCFDLNAIEKRGVPLGWCRGLWIDNDTAYVGYTRIRQTNFRQNLSWLTHGLKTPAGYKSLPTRVAAYDLAARQLIDEWSVEEAGLNALFSILPV